MPTASAVVADMIDTAVGRTDITFRRLELWSQRESGIALRATSLLSSRYYMRFCASDEPGVLAEITGILGRNQISIASVIQHEPTTVESALGTSANHVPIVIMTHQAPEGAAQKAVEQIQQLATVHGPSIRMRVLEK
jgi:homoserine dehydrogenase